MEGIQKYVLSVIISALICGILPGLLQKGATKDITKVICGLILTLNMISPFRSVDLAIPEQFLDLEEDLEASAVSEGENLAQTVMAEIIKAETEAYILDKALELNAQIQVEIHVSRENPPVPVSTVISGNISDLAREKLQEILCAQLNIPKEEQTWIE